MANPFIGEVMLCPYNFAPLNWVFCQGQVLPITQYTALFSLIGTFYGGNGTSTFALPNLIGRVPIAFGQAPGGSSYVMGESGGVETVTLAGTEVPSHNHLVNVAGPPQRGQQPATSPGNNYFGENETTQFYAAPTSLARPLNAASISSTAGGPLPHNNMMPLLVLNWCIALVGVFPTRS
jgi:microcystin-dependent protein